MALFPPSAELIRNPAGTAFGLAVRHGRAWLMAFPGVPMELKEMWAAWARPRLAEAVGGTIRSHLLRYVGVGEAALAEQVADLLEGANPSVAPYAGDAEVHLRVTALAATEAEAEALMAPVLARLRAIAPHYYGEDDTTLPAAVGRLLQAAGQTVACGESCTGGLLASRLTDVSGSSAWVRGGVVAYMTDVKTGVLGIDPALVGAHGVVSEAVAIALAERARDLLGATWGVGVTGWAGAAPDLPADQVGLVWIGVAGPGGSDAVEGRFGGFPREVVKQRATQAALDHLRRRVSVSHAPGA
jgi:nicotinamide-nucleotide amidase